MKLYNEKGYFIPHHVSKESPCWVCKAENDNAHTSYCPNIRYLKELKREVKETMNPKDLIKKMRLEDEVFIFEKGWNSALEKIKSCLPNIFTLYNTRPTEKELRKLLEELQVKKQ